MSDPAEFGPLIAALPADVGYLSRVVQGILVHSDWMPAYGLKGNAAAASRTTLPVAERLRQVVGFDHRPLDEPRPPDMRMPATCRDFALMLCGLLRAKGAEARVRCGFATYLASAPFEDHWVCQYRNARGEWRYADPQIDDVLGERLTIAFDPTELPRNSFIPGGDLWVAIQRGGLDAGSCGHGEHRGLWFVAVNVVRDHLALNGRLTSAWDGWRAATEAQKAAFDSEVKVYDELARKPEQPATSFAPYWLRG